MSLAVWLPLNGDLHNQGLLPVTITEYGDMTISNSGKIGKCYTFDGKDDYLSLAGLNFSGLSEFSFSFWCKPLKNSLYGIFQIKSGGTVALQFATATSFTFRDSKHSSLTGVSFNTPVAGEWAHYTFVYNKGSWLVYKNGIQDGSGFTAIQEATFYQSSTTFFIGCRKVSSKNSYFSGDLNDFRIYNHALSPKEVEEIAKGLVLHYPLNQLYDNNIIYDTSGYCNNGEIVGNITTITPSPRYNCCIEHLDSCADYIYREYLSFLGDSGFTFSCWINPTSYSRTNNTTTAVGSQFILSQGRDTITSGTNNTRGASLIIYNGKPQFFCGNGSLYSNTTIPIGEWAHVVGVWTGTQKKIYVNGILKGSANDTGIDWIESQNSLVIGKMAYGKNSTSSYFPFVGKISDVRIYATALTDNQIKELYNTSMQIDSSGNIYARELVEL